jgi:hypothetical protein
MNPTQQHPLPAQAPLRAANWGKRFAEAKGHSVGDMETSKLFRLTAIMKAATPMAPQPSRTSKTTTGDRAKNVTKAG